MLGRLWSRLLEVEFVDRAVALAAKAFVCFFPLLIIVAALSPQSIRADVVSSLTTRFGISGEPFEIVRQAFATADQTRTASGIVGVLLTVVFGVAFTSALQRTCLRAWRRPPGGGAWNKGRGAAWVGGVLVLLMVLTLARRSITGFLADGILWAAGLVGSVCLWWWTARLMTRGEVRWRPLLPTAVLSGLGMWIYTLAATVWMPRTLLDQYAQFGAFGVGLAFVTWFTGAGFLIVVAAVLGPALADGQDRFAGWLRGGRPTALEPSAPPALPGPSRPMRLSDLFGRNRPDPPLPDGSQDAD